MKTFEKIVQSKTAPKGNVIWLKDKQLLYFNNGQWVPLSDENFIIESSIKEVKESLKNYVTKDGLETQISSLVSIDNKTIYREDGSLSVKLGTGLRKDYNGISLTNLIAGTDNEGGYIKLTSDPTNNGTDLKLFNLGSGLLVSTGATPKIQLNISSRSPLSAGSGVLDINIGTGLIIGGFPQSIGVNIGKGLAIGSDKALTVSVSSDYMTTKADGTITIDINKLKSEILDIEYLKEALGLI